MDLTFYRYDFEKNQGYTSKLWNWFNYYTYTYIYIYIYMYTQWDYRNPV